MMVCDHHIFCIGAYTAPFAKMCAEQLVANCPPENREGLRVYVHTDALEDYQAKRFQEWLSGPQIEVTVGLFGVKAGQRVSGHWHQIMINRISELYIHSPWLAFVDADNFVADDTWYQAFENLNKNNLYLATQGIRRDRTVSLNGKVYSAASTKLFAIRPTIHNQVCDQRFNRDKRALKILQDEFPDATLRMGKSLDCMVAPSLKAQLCGYRISDVNGIVNTTHVGGFAHIRKSKFRNNPPARTTMWIQRLRLNRRVRDSFVEMGWSSFIDEGYEKRLSRIENYVTSVPALRVLWRDLSPSKSEKNFESILQQLRYPGRINGSGGDCQ